MIAPELARPHTPKLILKAEAQRQNLNLVNVLDVLAHGEDKDGDGVLDFEDFSSAFG